MTPSKKAVEEANKICEEIKLACHQQVQPYVAMDLALPIIALSIDKSIREAIEEIAQMAKDRQWGDEYKDCPAAWLSTAYENFEKAIRKLLEEPK